MNGIDEISHAARAFSLLLAGGALARVMKLTAAALVLSEISSLALRHLAPPAAGLCKTRKRKQRSSELDTVFSFSFCGEDEIRTRGTVNPYVSLANWWFQPLTHLSGNAFHREIR